MLIDSVHESLQLLCVRAVVEELSARKELSIAFGHRDGVLLAPLAG